MKTFGAPLPIPRPKPLRRKAPIDQLVKQLDRVDIEMRYALKIAETYTGQGISPEMVAELTAERAHTVDLYVKYKELAKDSI